MSGTVANCKQLVYDILKELAVAASELRSCVKVKLPSWAHPSLINLMVSMDMKHYARRRTSLVVSHESACTSTLRTQLLSVDTVLIL